MTVTEYGRAHVVGTSLLPLAKGELVHCVTKLFKVAVSLGVARARRPSRQREATRQMPLQRSCRPFPVG
jgi:hypothetical protein